MLNIILFRFNESYWRYTEPTQLLYYKTVPILFWQKKKKTYHRIVLVEQNNRCFFFKYVYRAFVKTIEDTDDTLDKKVILFLRSRKGNLIHLVLSSIL